MANAAALSAYRFDGYESKIFVNNKWIKPHSKRTLSVRNPKDNTVITEFHPIADQTDVDEVVKIAREAFFKGPWSSFSGSQRAACINKLADLIDENAEQLAWYESICAGRLMAQLKYEVPWIANVFRYYAGWCDKLEGESFTDDDGFYKIVRHEPIGVCAGITPWNGGLFVLALKAAPALAAGNTFILKPPEKSPLSSLFATTLFEKAGFPPGVFQVVTGDGSTGALLAGHQNIEKVSFTGSIKIGQIIQNLANNSNMKRVTLELGGKSPALVFDDCDLEQAVQWLSRGITQNAGQNCTCSSRIYVQKGIAQKFIEGMKTRLEAIGTTLGSDPQEDSTIFGPVVDQAQYDNVHRFIASGKEQATLITGGYKYDKAGFYVPPTLFADPKPDAEIYKEEIFGPVGCVRTFETEDEVIEWANDSHYGLAAYVFSESIERMFRITKQLRAGTVGVNAISQLFPQTPFGGYKKSGLGRELGKYALLDFTEPKTIFIRTKRF